MAKLTFEEVASVPTPATGKTSIYVDSADSHVKQIDDTGTVIDLVDAPAHTHTHASTTGQGTDDHHARDHASTHGPAAADPLKLDDLATPDDNTDLNVSTSAHGLTPKLSNVSTEYLSGTGVYSTPPSGGDADVLTTKGDLVSFSTIYGRLPVGANGAVLTSDSTEAFGVKWNSIPKEINLSFGNENTKNTSYEVMAVLKSPGTTDYTVTKVEIIAYQESDPATYSLKLYDLDNALAICEKTGNSNTVSSIIDLGTISNQDSAQAIYEVQAKWDSATASGKEKVYVQFLTITF